MNQQGVSLSNIQPEQTAQYVESLTSAEFVKEYLSLPRPHQERIYGFLTPAQQKVLWQAYEDKKFNFAGLSKQELKIKYLELSKEDQKAAYAKMDAGQQKMVWEIFEEVKKEKEANANNPKQPESDIPDEGKKEINTGKKIKKEEKKEEDDDTVDLISIPPNLRKSMLEAMNNEDLVKAYKKIKNKEDTLTIWGELSPSQKEVIQQAAQIEAQKKKLEALQSNYES